MDWRVPEKNGSGHLAHLLLNEVVQEVNDRLRWHGVTLVKAWNGAVVKDGTAMVNCMTLAKKELILNVRVVESLANVWIEERKPNNWFNHNPIADAGEFELSTPDSLQKIINFVKSRL